MTLDQWSAQTTTGKSILAEGRERLTQWEDGMMTDQELLETLAGWFTQTANALQNPVE